ncbi:MAG TPA: recombination mediator RecR [Spirochaetota bacterium]|nr:recombination mediator RecR [Spirochaetota bacterium]HPC40633.1 recombination mediator RecR [Spirochaetota bacterium]HPL19277.1 recombination mediator RecR [Spirochaetota bacterium]HQF10256.1 recombination mediator RecR [Spirochaetota bacterium]HQH99134.1 recombination mediator RecR [Spirochaetota bacterium]
MKSSAYLEALIKKFSKLPGIGPKSASRIAFHILGMHREDVESLARAMVDLKRNTFTCSQCGGISDGETCAICLDPARDRGLICVVEDAKDVLTIDGTGEFGGLYHVLHGLISPLDGIGPDELNIQSLVEKCRGGAAREVILALNPSVEGDATSLYMARLINPFGVTVTRIAHGLPVGADLEFADTATIIKSLEGRVKI